MPTVEWDPSVSSVLLAAGLFTSALLVFAALTYAYLYRAHTMGARKATYALLLLSGSSVFLTLLYALSPRTLDAFPVVGWVLLLVFLFAYFTARFCPGCGRPNQRFLSGLQFTPCPYCGRAYED